MLTALAVPIGFVLLYLVLATAMPTSWRIDPDGLTLRSAAVLGIPIRVRWKDVESIGSGTRLVYHTTLQAMNLDGRVMWRRHITLVRRGGTRAVQFTPRHIAEFERQVGSALGTRPDWSLDESGWHRLKR